MGESLPRIIVVSAVNIRKGGTLTILRECLQYLSAQEGLKVYALVHRRDLCDYPGIEYLEFPWTIKGWGRRLWCEYVTMHRISLEIEKKECREIDTWLSLHDTTPRVKAKHREVYCHTSFPFLKWTLRDLRMDPKIPLFAMFTRFAYRINIKRNDCLIVQQEWFRDGLSRITGFPKEKIRVIPPKVSLEGIEPEPAQFDKPTFLYVSTATRTSKPYAKRQDCWKRKSERVDSRFSSPYLETRTAMQGGLQSVGVQSIQLNSQAI